jgi:D-alanyl-lipoteichoic acid acyltransferase DltB (MBOAT superfamily)
VYRRLTADRDPARYALFVSYFPHLIAGPILHHKPTMEQFTETTRVAWPASQTALLPEELEHRQWSARSVCPLLNSKH